MEIIDAQFDGAFDAHTGKASYGFIVRKDGKIIKKESGICNVKPEKASCNVAEYFGIFCLLKWLKENDYKNNKIYISGDSKLVINQMKNKWRIKNGLYTIFATNTKIFLLEFPHVKLKWIPREENQEADFLSKNI